MFDISVNLPYLHGLPGYGVLGNDGEKGLNGISLYISSLDGCLNESLITADINGNLDLNGSGKKIPGFDTSRVYQTGDYFIDAASRVCQIDLSTSKRFKPSGLKLNYLDIFEYSLIKNTTGYDRYINKSSTQDKVIVDSAITDKKSNYLDVLDNKIYDIPYKDFGHIMYNDKPTNTGVIDMALLTGGNRDHNAIVLRYDTSTNTFIFGNRDKNNELRSTNLIFDYYTTEVNRGRIINEEDLNGNILTNVEISTPFLFDFDNDPAGISITAENNSVLIYWDKTKFFKNLQQSALNKIRMDLVFYQPISVKGNSYNFDNAPNNNIYIYSLPDIGSVSITNLLTNTMYKSYLQFSYNNYHRISNVANTTTGIAPVMQIYYNGSLYNNGDTINIPAILYNSVYTFSVSTNGGNWSITDRYNTFTTISPKLGNGSSNFNVTINSNNYNPTTRLDKFTVTLDQYSSIYTTINLLQASFDGQLSCSPTSLSYSYNGEVRAFGVTTNLGSWTISGPDWCEIVTPNGMIGNQTVNVKPSANDSSLSRTGQVSVISTNRPDVSARVNITQEGKPIVQNTVSADPSGLLFDGDGNAQIVTLIFNNTDYFTVSTPSWMTSTPTNGYPSEIIQDGPIQLNGIYRAYIKLTCSTYVNGNLRNGVVTITNGNGSCQINVTQTSTVETPSKTDPPYTGGGGGCLEISTPVTLENGMQLSVGDLKPGYKILGHFGNDIHEFAYKGFDSKPRLIFNTVINNEIKEFNYYYNINDEFKCSETHNLFIYRDGYWQWVLSPYLRKGDLMFHISGKKVPITSIEHVNAPIKVAYLTLLRPNTYFAAGYLHHNTAAEKEMARE